MTDEKLPADSTDNNPRTDDGKADKPSSVSGSDSSRNASDDDRIRKLVREEIVAAIPQINTATSTGAAGGTRMSIEAEAERQVRAAAEKLKLETENETLKKQVQAVVEAPPVAARRITKLLWGDK